MNDATFALSMVFLEELGATGNKVGCCLLHAVACHGVVLVVSLRNGSGFAQDKDVSMSRFMKSPRKNNINKGLFSLLAC